MKRSTINAVVRQSTSLFVNHGWHLPAQPRWDVTDFGLGNFEAFGLVLINLAEEPEYCEKLMVALGGQRTPAHWHKQKKEDIIARAGSFSIQLWASDPTQSSGPNVKAKIDGQWQSFDHGQIVTIAPGQRITLVPGVWHEFWAEGDYCIIGEVSTANDDANDNFFANPDIGRYAAIDEDEAPIVKLVSDR